MNETWTIKYRHAPALPKLAWLASVPLAAGQIDVFHGSAVELGADWLVEGTWDGRFGDGGFHRSEAFFGSGLRIDGDRVVACASTALVDRLLYHVTDGRVMVSNSFPLLLAASKARPDRRHNYWPECHASLKGIFERPRPFRVSSPTVDAFEQLFHGNLMVTGGAVSVEVRSTRRTFDSFEAYAGQLRSTLTALRANYQSPDRAAPMRAFATLSAGYDSPAVACLAREQGVKECFTTRPTGSRGRGSKLENGAAIAEALGLTPHLLMPPSSATGPHEAYFVSTTLGGSELIFHDMAVHIAAEPTPAVVFTGYHGDKVWDVHTYGRYLADDILRGDCSGLHLSEVRLKAGFVNVAVPFLFARSISDIVAISQSEPLAPWRLGTDYDRPIPRRIVESAGVPRHLFGQRKRVVMAYYNRPFNPELRRAFRAWLARECGVTLRTELGYEILDRVGHQFSRTARKLGLSDDSRLLARPLKRLVFSPESDLRQLVFKWAVDHLAGEFREALKSA